MLSLGYGAVFSLSLNKLLGLVNDFEHLFGGTIVYWDTELVYLAFNTDYRFFNCKYYPVPRMKKETFCKKL